jgi:predicted nuclease with RNAse H fold
MIAGIDYGSKLAGTTVIAWEENGALCLQGSAKKQDADAMILAWAKAKRPSLVMLDAPLSLPGVYRGMEGYIDYFYRKGDKMLAAMSPMFLGGLTARAMKLKAELARYGVQVQECYPRQVGERVGLRGVYAKASKGAVQDFMPHMLEQLNLSYPTNETLSWHHADAALALLSAQRFIAGKAEAFGDEEEGRIWV